ncbi:hypothetical protein BGZ65_010523 [Modicella reniformis]|uniref:Transmembrane protein 135 N-terminal domain-containing protein n=1 Tax=Modicella reniformis TaxID=1440133 RepID=A0A9P6ITS7_9FUNG|nr:hypothetical protein BGZ65_010523 [Modicella reniformis]
MFSWQYAPERLPGPYAFWITKMSHMDKRLLSTLRAIRLDKIHFGQPNTPEYATQLMDLCSELGMDPSLGDIGRHDILPCAVVHQGTFNNCEIHTLYRWMQGFLVSTGIYLPVHLLPALLTPKTFFSKLQANPIATASSTLLAPARSSAFLASYIALSWYGICCWRSRIMPAYMKLTGRRYTSNVVDNIYGPLLASFMCGFSILIEKPQRRAEMSLYVLPRAMYSMWTRVMSGRLSRRMEIAGETLMYGFSMSVLLTAMMWKRGMVRSSMQGLLGWMLETPKTKKQHGQHHNKGKTSELVSKAAESSLPAVKDKDLFATV